MKHVIDISFANDEYPPGTFEYATAAYVFAQQAAIMVGGILIEYRLKGDANGGIPSAAILLPDDFDMSQRARKLWWLDRVVPCQYGICVAEDESRPDNWRVVWPPFAVDPEWTKADSIEAGNEGWNISFCTGVDEDYRLERNDEMAVFEDDKAAWIHVREKAKAGSALHQRAMDFLLVTQTDEYRRIMTA